MADNNSKEGTEDFWAKVLLFSPIVGLALALVLLVFASLNGDEEVVTKEDVEKILSVSGTVEEINYRENQAEDGFYSFAIRTSKDTVVKVSATGFMNTPRQPADAGWECVDVPRPMNPSTKEPADGPAVGDDVTVFLPKSNLKGFDFVTCWESDGNDPEYFVKFE